MGPPWQSASGSTRCTQIEGFAGTFAMLASPGAQRAFFKSNRSFKMNMEAKK